MGHLSFVSRSDGINHIKVNDTFVYDAIYLLKEIKVFP